MAKREYGNVEFYAAPKAPRSDAPRTPRPPREPAPPSRHVGLDLDAAAKLRRDSVWFDDHGERSAAARYSLLDAAGPYVLKPVIA